MLVKRILVLVAATLLLVVGCDDGPPPANTPPDGASDDGAAVQKAGGSDSVFAAAAADAEPNEKPFLEGSRPFLTAIAARNYSGAYDLLSSHAKAKMFSGQFLPSASTETSSGQPLENLTREQFMEWMAKTEGELGVPESIRDVSVFETDPQVLAGKGDRLSVAFAIGGMPESVPANIRRASIRSGLTCKRNKAWAEAIANDLDGVTAEQVMSGQLSAENKEMVEESLPYMNLKFVLVDEGGQLKVGYVEFMPPSMLD